MQFQAGKLIAGRYKVIRLIDHGKFGHVLSCKDNKKNRIVAAKISNDKSFDVDNAKVESKLLEKLSVPPTNDKEVYDCLLHMEESFMFENRVIIIFESLNLSLFFY